MSPKRKNIILSTYYLFAISFSLFVALQFEFGKGASGNANGILVYSQLGIAAYAVYGIVLWSVNSNQPLIIRLMKAALLLLPLVVLSCINQWFLAGGRMNIAYSNGLVRYGSAALFEGPMTVMVWAMVLIVILSYVKRRWFGITHIEPLRTAGINNRNRIIHSAYGVLAFVSFYVFMPLLYPNKYYLYLSQLWIDLQRGAASNDMAISWYLSIFLFHIVGALLLSVFLSVLIFTQAHYVGRIFATLKKRFSTTVMLTCLVLSALTLGSLGFVLYVEGREFIEDTFRQSRSIYWQVKLTIVFCAISMCFLLSLKSLAIAHTESKDVGLSTRMLYRFFSGPAAYIPPPDPSAANHDASETQRWWSHLMQPSCWSLVLTANLIMIVVLNTTSFSSSLHAELVQLKTSSSHYRTLTMDDFIAAQEAGWKEEIPEFPLKAPGFFPRSTR